MANIEGRVYTVTSFVFNRSPYIRPVIIIILIIIVAVVVVLQISMRILKY